MKMKLLSVFITIVMTFSTLHFRLTAVEEPTVITREFVAGSIQEDFPLIYPPQPRLLSSSLLPEQYIGNEYVSVVEDQRKTSLCWAFAATSAVESNMLKNNQGLHNFSELHMGYSTSVFHAGMEYGMRPYPDSGGNRSTAASYFMRGIPLSGVVKESDDPLVLDTALPRDLSITESKPRSFTVQNVIFFSGEQKEDISETQIKQAVLTYGSVSASMYWEYNREIEDAYHLKNHAYYLSEGPVNVSGGKVIPKINHDLAIVGWDDNFPKEKFNTIPERDGAWRVKNSWGDDWGESGFHWISYEDTNFPLFIYAVDGVQPYKSDSVVYEYDYRSWSNKIGYDSTVNFYSRVFTAKSGQEVLNQVIVAVPTPNVTVSVDIIPVFDGFSDYNAAVFKDSIKGNKTTTYPGYYTVDLDIPVTLGKT
ncbi:MAG: lectin like domain-containing protein, partial [Oscillospiraceae bacterium]|nr:lectin like domain-containing protein [Oscillospiraceae bacterium]